jgi:hypothetical protein
LIFKITWAIFGGSVMGKTFISCCCLLLLSSFAYAGKCIDDFENGNADGWKVVEGDWEVQEGVYVQLGLDLNEAGIPRTIIQSPWEFGNGSIEVTISFDNKSDGTEIPAILYRMTDENNGYAFRLRSNHMEVGKLLDGQYNNIRGDAQKVNIDKPCKMRLEVDGIFTKVYYNGEIKARIGDPNGKGDEKGLIGLAVFDASKPVYFDDIIINGEGISPFHPLSHPVEPSGKLVWLWGDIRNGLIIR